MQTRPVADTILRMGQLLEPRQGVDDTLVTIVEAEPLRMLGARGTVVFLANEREKTLVLAHHRHAPDCLIGQASYSIDADDLAPRAARRSMVEADEASGTVAIPLAIGTRRIGVLVIACSGPWMPNADERIGLQALGSFIALAVLRAADHETEHHLKSRIEIIRNAGVAIADELAVLPEGALQAAVLQQFRLWPNEHEVLPAESLRSVLQTIVEYAAAAVDAQFGALGVGDSPDRPFEPWVFTGVDRERADAIGRTPRAVGTLGLVAREGQVVRASDVRKHPVFQGLPSGHPEITSLLAVPVRYRGVNLGNLYLANKVGARDFDEEDQQTIELLASQAALSLQHAYFRAAVDAQRAQLKTILRSVPQGFLFVDDCSGRVVANPRAKHLLGESGTAPPEPTKYPEQFRGPDGRRLSSEELPSSQALAKRTITDEEFRIVQRDGKEIPVLLSAAPVIGSDQKLLGAVVTFEDISALKELERFRDEFAAVMAHDLRDPIQGILFEVNLLMRHAEGDVLRAPVSLVQGIEKNARRLGQMTNDLLDATRVNLARIVLDREPLDVPEAVRNLVERIRPAFLNHPVDVRVCGQIPPAWVDPLRFDQILTNLLDNAAKFSDEHSVITVHIRARDDGLEIAVEDHGVGIPADEVSRLFDRFYQGSRARERKTGLGLGLYITKGLVEAHGGRLSVESELGQRSVFRAWFPGEADMRGQCGEEHGASAT